MIRPSAGNPHGLVPFAFAAVALAACSGDPGPVGEAAVAHYELVEIATIGGAVDEGPDAFGRITGVAFVPGGRIAVLDDAYHEIRLFGGDGRFLSRAGREGSGPAEMRSPYGIGVAPDGAIWVRDTGNGRYVRFTVEGDSLQAGPIFAIGEGAQGPAIAPTFLPDGRVVHIGLAADAEGRRAVLTRFTLAGSGLAPAERLAVAEPSPDSIGQFAVPIGDGVTRFFYQPFAPQFLQAHADGGDWARGVGSAPTVERYDASGTLRHRVTVTPEDVPLSPTEQARADSALVRDRRAAGRDLPFAVPATKPPLRAIHFDAAGRLWVEHNVADGARRIADLFDPTGAPQGRVSWPAPIDLRLGALGDGLIAGVARDELDVQRVVLLRLQPPARPAPTPTPTPR